MLSASERLRRQGTGTAGGACLPPFRGDESAARQPAAGSHQHAAASSIHADNGDLLAGRCPNAPGCGPAPAGRGRRAMTLAEHVERYVTFPLPRMELAPGVESIQSASRSRAAEPARPTTAPRDTTRAAASPIALRDGPRQRGLSLYAAPGAADSGSHGDFERIPVLCPGPASDRNARLDRYNSTCRRFNGDLTTPSIRRHCPSTRLECSPRSPVALEWGRPRKLARNSAGDH